MILDCEKTANYISGWIKDYANKAGVKSLVLGLSGGIDSALVSLLCKRTGMPVITAFMGCHSSPSAYERAGMFASEQGLPMFVVNLDTAHKTIVDQFKSIMGPALPPGVIADWDGNGSVGALRSCLRAPTLSYLSHATNGIIVGTGNRSEDHLTRFFQKGGDGVVDISVISDLHKSEVYELFKYLSEESNNGVMAPGARSIFEAVPSPDLWGPNAGHEDEKELQITYQEIEWADRENDRTSSWKDENGNITASDNGDTGIVSNNIDPAKHPSGAWQSYTGRQQFVISRVWNLEKVSRHKVNKSLPCCELRDVPGLVK